MGVHRFGAAGVAVLLIGLVTGCAGTRPAPKPTARPTPHAASYSGGLQTLAPDAPPSPPAPPLTAYGLEVWVTDTYLGSMHSLDSYCEELRSADCGDAAHAWELIVGGSAQRIAALAPPGPGEPQVSGVLDALSAYAAAIHRVVLASDQGGQDVYDGAMAQIDAARTALDDTWGDSFQGYGREMYGVETPPIAAQSPFPAAPGRAPTARDPFTATAERLDARIEPVLAHMSTVCTEVMSDACAAAIDPYEVDINDVASQLHRSAAGRGDEDGATEFGAAVFELQEAITSLRDANRGTGVGLDRGFAPALLHDGAWRLHRAVSILRDGPPPTAAAV